MPDEPDKVDVVVKKLSNFTIPFLVQSLQKQEVEVFLPQMTIVNKNLNLTSVLIRSGIRRVFDPKKANLRASLTEGTKGIHLAKLEQNAFFSTSFVALNSVSGISAGSSKSQKDFFLKLFSSKFSVRNKCNNL